MRSGPAPVERDQPTALTGAEGATRSPVVDSSAVVLYDGVCGLCNRYVQFVLARDHHRRFRFAPLQGPFAAQALARHGLAAPDAPDSIILLEAPGSPNERARVRSDAVLRILVGLGGGWRLAAILRVIPRVLRDAVYGVVARIRYRVFGRSDRCLLPPPSSRDRFLD